MTGLCILASLIWGANIVFMKSLLVSQPAPVVAFWRVIFSALVLFMLGRWRHLSFKIERKMAFSLTAVGLFNVTLNFSLSMMGMAMIQGTSVAMFNALSPVIIAFLIWLFDHQKPSLKKILALGLTLIGVGCSFQFDWGTLTLGHLLLVLSLASYSGSFLWAKKMKLDSIIKSFYTMLFGGCLLGGFLVYKKELTFLKMSLGQWCLFGVISVAGFAFIQWVYFTASEKIGMKKTSFYMNLNPLFTYLGSVVFLQEPLTVHEFAAMALILLGLAISQNEKESSALS